MEFNEYQELARTTAIYPNVGNNIWYPTLGLCGESGEVAENVKKLYRDDEGNIYQERLRKIRMELGDVLWYVSNIASELGLTLDDIANANRVKLATRAQNNTLHGSGDNR